MNDAIAETIKKQLIKLGIVTVVVTAALGARVIHVAREPSWSEADIEASLQEDGGGHAAPEPEEQQAADEGGGSSLFSFVEDGEAEPKPLSTRAMPCYVNGQKLFMLHSDCVTRGGLPEVR